MKQSESKYNKVERDHPEPQPKIGLADGGPAVQFPSGSVYSISQKGTIRKIASNSTDHCNLNLTDLPPAPSRIPSTSEDQTDEGGVSPVDAPSLSENE